MPQMETTAGPARPGVKRRAAPRNSLPAAYLRLVLEIAAERGVDPGQVLRGTRISLAQLAAPESRVKAADAARAVTNAVHLSGDFALGLEMGLRTKPTAHGYLGYAVMSCNSLRESLEVAIRFVQLRQRDVSLTLTVDGADGVLQADDAHDLGAQRQFFLEGMMIGLARVAGFVLGEAMLDCELCFDWAEPPYFAAYRSRLPRVRFAAPAVQLRLDAHLLERQPLMADAGAAQQALEQCEREQALGSREPDNIVRRVRAELTLSADGYPDLSGISARLFTSNRTLKRRLQQCGTSFQVLRDEARHRDALRLMENPDMEIRQVAAVLGYKDPPSFTRAFRRWTGMTPIEVKHRTHAASGRA